MRDILSDLDRWRAEGRQMALATVVQTWGSSPRRVGAKMLVTSEGEFAGSVSGGCVENAVIDAALDCLKTDRARLLHFGVADETAWGVGLSCGGSIDVFVKQVDAAFLPSVREAWASGASSVHITVVRGSEHILGREVLVREDGVVTGSLGNHRQRKAVELSNAVFQSRTSQRTVLDEDTELFLEWIAPPPTLVAVGGVHIAVALMSLAKTLGYRTVVIDPRGAWGNEKRFPRVDQLLHTLPEEAFQKLGITSSTAIAMLTHDPKFDDAALLIALTSPAFYIGALGGRRTNDQRRERLLNAGVSEEQLSRLRAPIGIDIGAETPEEIALAILAEVVEAYRKQAERLKQEHPVSNL